jgi:phytoene dehydrogenase-like protein
VIVGAGAAGSAAAKCFAAANCAGQTIWFEQHSEMGGSAGYFSRGQPRRTFDAGATQLIECASGALQERLYSLAPAKDQAPAEQIFQKIDSITQHWPALARRVVLHADGNVVWNAERPPTPSEQNDIDRLKKFLGTCAKEADWMWKLLADIPRFPPQNFRDVLRALKLFLQVPLRKKITFPYLFLASARHMMRRHGIAKEGLADDVIRGLLVDTTQSTPEHSPWLAAAMGISILSRGIYRCRKGMRAYFRPLLSSFEEHQGSYLPHHQLVRIETHSDGFLLSCRNTHSGDVIQYLATESLMLNLTLWDLCGSLFPENDPVRRTRIFQTWKKKSAHERGWGAWAVYALVEDKPEWDDGPLFHQIFPSPTEHPLLQSSLYVSIPARDDPAHPAGQRVLTATLHVEARDYSSEERNLFTAQLVARIEEALRSKLSHVESALPATFAKYTGRAHGQVGGFPLTHRNFMFGAPPAQLVHPINKRTKLLLMGDTVFPGQGVVACSVSGIVAFERATNLTFASLAAKHFRT